MVEGAAAVIAALAAAGVGIYNAVDSSTQNKRSMYAQGMQNYINNTLAQQQYDRERADNRADWAAQNAYNHPDQQMTRLRQAGLNPHLIYGKGADATAESIKPAGYHQINNPAPRFLPTDLTGLQNAIGVYQDARLKGAQTDNVNESTALMQQEAILKQATTAKTLQDTAKTKFDLEQAQDLKDTVIQKAKLENEKLKADTRYTTNQDQRSELKNTSDLKYTAEKILTEKLGRAKTQEEIKKIQEDILALRQSRSIREYHQNLTKMGIAPNDPWYFRGLMNLVHGNLSVPSWMKGVEEQVKRTQRDYKYNGGNLIGPLYNRLKGK